MIRNRGCENWRMVTRSWNLQLSRLHCSMYKTLLYRNIGYSGGALAFHHDTNCEFPHHYRKNWNFNDTDPLPTPVCTLVNNTAVQHGGVILADEVCKEGQYLVTTHRLMLELLMEGNRARKAGDSIFGGCLNSCYTYLKTLSLQHKVIPTPQISSLFQIHERTQLEVAAT